MPGPRNRPGPDTHPPKAPKHPVGSTGGGGSPVAPKALAAWSRVNGVLATQGPTSLRQAALFRRYALRALK